MPQNYPDNEDYALQMSNAELTANGKVWNSIKSVKADQGTTEGFIRGMKGKPIKRTQGTQDMGDGTLEFEDYAELVDFIDSLGDGYRDKIWQLSYTLTSKVLKKSIKVRCISCRILNNPIDHESGSDTLGGEIVFSFMDHLINGKRPHL